MPEASSARTSLTILATLAVLWSASAGAVFLAPLTLAFFLVALVWPIQQRLRAIMPKAVAVIVTFAILFAVLIALSTVVVWALENIRQTISSNYQRYEVLYRSMTDWLEANGIVLAGLWAETFDVNWMLRIGQQLLARTSQTMSFWAIVVAYVLTLLVEIGHIGDSIDRCCSGHTSGVIRRGVSETARKLRIYMGVRSVVSVVTGTLIAIIAYALGLPLALEWGVIGFVLNFIPVIGPLIATLLPTAFAFAHIGDPFLAVVLFGGLTVLQFAGGNYIEPKVAGDTLRLSPFIVLIAVFLGTFIWGLYGTFIGVPIAIAIACFAEQIPSARWLLGFMGAGGVAPLPVNRVTESDGRTD